MNIQKADSHAPIILSKKIFKELSSEGWTQQLNIYIYILFFCLTIQKHLLGVVGKIADQVFFRKITRCVADACL